MPDKYHYEKIYYHTAIALDRQPFTKMNTRLYLLILPQLLTLLSTEEQFPLMVKQQVLNHPTKNHATIITKIYFYKSA